MQFVQKRITALILLSVFICAVIAAPLTDTRLNDGRETDLEKVETSVTSQDGGVKETQTKQVQEAENVQKVDTEDDEDIPEEADDDRGQEVINYQDIQVDHNSKVTSENEGKKPDSDDEDEIDEEEDEEVDEEEGEEEEDTEYMLTPAAARELMLELRDPVEVAKFVVETDDAAGFLRALRLLLHDGYITEEQAYSLKDEVAAQLRNLLMLQQVELSRALFETYQPQIEADPNAELEGLLFNQPPQPVEYYDYANLINQDETPYGSSQGNLYDTYQEAIEEESSQALAEIAEILAQRIARGEITPEEGAKIMRKVVQLLPETYWSQSEEGLSSETMSSEYKTDDQMLDLASQTGEFLDDNQDDEDDEEDVNMEPEVENFEEELLEAGPDGLVKEIKVEDENDDEDAAELEEEAENLADELVDELKGGVPSKTETAKIERPGAKAVVKVGPSNDVMDQNVEQDWKDMSLLLDNNIPESVLRSLGISITKPGQEEPPETEENEEEVSPEEMDA